jgi:hypothetical protein
VKPTVLPVAKLLPSKPASGVIVPPAAPIRVAPVPVPVSPAADSPRPPRRRTARRDEDDDDFPDRTPRKSPVGTLVIISLIGLVLAGGLTAGIIVLVRATSSSDSADGGTPNKDGYVDPKPLWDPNKDPNRQPAAAPPANDPFVPPFNPAPVVPAPAPAPVPAKEPEWKAVENADGFEAKVPGELKLRDGFPYLRSGRMTVVGKTYEHQFPVSVPGVVHIRVRIDYTDVPAEYAFDLEKVLREVSGLRTGPATPAKWSGLTSLEIVQPFGNASVWTARGVKVGPRFFMVRCDTWNPFNQHPKTDEYRAKVFDSFKITFDEKTPAPPPVDAFGRPLAGGNPVPVAPTPVAPTAVTAPFVIAKPQPFWGAVFLPDTNELLTVGPRLLGNFGRGGGVLRRYTLPGFELKASYPMPRAATRAVYDVASATLYCTTLAGARPDASIRDSERVVAFGDVEAYDLGPVFKGTASEKDELKPTFTVPFSGSKLTGLDLSPDGKWLYTVRTTPLGTPTKPRGWKASLVRIDVSQRKMVDPIDLPTPVLHMKLSPDGKTIYLAEIQLSEFGGEILGAGQVGKVDAIDVVGWRLKHNLILNAPVLDVAVTKDGTRLVCGVQGRSGPGVAVSATAGGDVIGFDPSADTARVAGYVAVTDTGKRIVTSARLAEGVDVYEVTDLGRKDGLKLLARGKEAAGAAAHTPLGGHFYLSPDGRFAVFQVGSVIDVDAPTRKPD